MRPRRSLPLLVLAALVAGCAGPVPSETVEAPPVLERSLVVTPLEPSRDASGLGAVWLMGGGPVGPAVVLREWGDPPPGFHELRLRLEWDCANCVAGQQLRFGVQTNGALPDGQYREQAIGPRGVLEVTATPDDWSRYGLQASMVPVGLGLPGTGHPVSPLLLVTYELTGTMSHWVSAN